MANHISESLLNDSMDVDKILRRSELSTTATGEVTASSVLQNVMEHDGVTFSTPSGSTNMIQQIPSSMYPPGAVGGGVGGYSSLGAVPQPSLSLGTHSQTQSLGIGGSSNSSTAAHSLRFEYPLDDSDTPTKTKSKKTPPTVYREQDRFVPINNTGRVMRNAVPRNAKISKDAKQCMQECISEFISFLTSEASDRCIDEKKKTITGDDILFALSTLGFDNYVEPLHLYLKKYREFIRNDKPDKDDIDGCHSNMDDQLVSMEQSDSAPQGDPLGVDTHTLHMMTEHLPPSSNASLN